MKYAYQSVALATALILGGMAIGLPWGTTGTAAGIASGAAVYILLGQPWLGRRRNRTDRRNS